MTLRTTVAVKQKTCKNPDCKKRFRPARSTATFCSTECKERKNTISKRKPFTIPRSNHFFLYVTKEAQRAGTLAIFDTLVGSVDNLMALYEVVKLRMTANVMSGKDSFHICHIAPVKHDNILGLSNAENLVIAPAIFNRRHSSKHCNKAGVYMYRADAPMKLFVASDEVGLLDRIIDMIGEETVIAFCKKAKLKDSQRQASLEKLAKLIDHSNPDHARFIAILNDTHSKTPEIIAAVEAVQSRAEFKPMMKGQKLSDSAMLVKELIRHAEFRCELQEFADIATQYTREDFALTTLSIDAQRTLFDLLHGVAEEEMEDEVDCLKYELRAPMRKAVAAQELSAERARQNAIAAAELAERNYYAAISWTCIQGCWDAEDAGIEFCDLPEPERVVVPSPAPTMVYGPDEVAF